MASIRVLLILGLLFCVMGTQTRAQTCPTTFSKQNKIFTSCSQLRTLQATLSWTYDKQSGSVDVAFRAKPAASGGWVGWGINPKSLAMVGTQTLIAFRNSSGETYVNTYDLQSKSPPSPGGISISTTNLSAFYEASSGEITIFAVMKLPSGSATVNHVWNVGSSFIGVVPQAHAFDTAHTTSLATIDLSTGVATGASNPNQHLKNRHGVINAVGWGIMMPIGGMIARYMRMFDSADPAWFYLHAFCQTAGYALGVAGWGTGLKLGSDSKGIEYGPHRKIGITLFVLGTLQVFALLLRPKKEHKLRKYWNIYHHFVGYAVIILSVINIFKGFDILKPDHKWKKAYIAVISCLGGIAVILEIVTWIISFKRKSKKGLLPSATATADGNGYRSSSV
eukprot:TRINITY_DN37699_c0_g1_i1.p1 TRINITY_DN37699_c0_g1~~TRINITY_DN37699_c0_g1_i1.p1  ORF type:complete len:442 (+),score=24.30 TRINITY_DN37699_c0_g1_i1:149-1327(+)